MRPSSSVEPNRCFNARSIRSEWCRSPSNDSTVSTTCSSARGPASAPSLVTCPTSSVAMPVSFASRTSRCAPSRTCATEPAAPGESGSCTVWIESIASTSGRELLDVRAHRRQRRFRDDEHIGLQGAEPVGAEPHLRGRLLAAHEQAPRARGGHRAERLEQQRALAHARLAADERHRAGDEPAVEHAIELRQPRGPARCAERVDLRDGDRAVQRGARSTAGRRTGGPDRRLAEAAPLAAVGTAAEPLRGLVAALRTPIANTRSGHGGSVSAACDSER